MVWTRRFRLAPATRAITLVVLGFAAVLTSFTLLALPASAVPSDPPGSGEDRWADDFYAPGTGRGPGLDRQVILGGFESHGSIVVFGNFTILDNQPISHVARFDGEHWQAMGPGTSQRALHAVQDGEDVLILFADRSIRRWQGDGWTVEIPVAPADVSALALWNGETIVGGSFPASGPVPAHLVERWSGAAWEPMGPELGNGWVSGFTIYRGNLVVWGVFRVEGAEPIANIAEWDGTTWKALDAGLAHPVVAAAVHEDQLYVVSHEVDHSMRTPHLSRWDGHSWASEDAALPGGEFVPEDLMSVSGHMFLAGVFSRSDLLWWFGTRDPPYQWTVAEYVAGQVTPLHEVRGGAALDLFTYGGQLVSAGWFVSIGGAAAHGLATLDASGEWKPLTAGNGVDALWQDDLWPQAYPVEFVEFRGEWIAAGPFTSAGGRAIAGIARYTADGWQRLGDGVDGPVTAVAVLDNKLYVAGAFEHAGGQPANGMAVWDGAHWEPFGNERIQGTVETIAMYQGQIIVGGSFFYIGTLQSPNIARWNGTAWERMPATVFGVVHDLVDFGGTLLAGGDFNWNGARSIGAVAAWTGTEWTTLGDQPISSVSHLRLHDGELVATARNSGDKRRLLRWTGSTWTAIGEQPDADVEDFTSYHGSLVGSFLWYEQVSPNGYRQYGRLYRLQGSEWVPLSRRYEADVRTLASFGGRLYCGGPFVEIDGHRAAGVARWDGGPTAIVVQDLAAIPTVEGVCVTWHVDPAAAAGVVSVRPERADSGDRFVSLGVFEAQSLERAPGAYGWTDRDVSPGAGYSYRIGLQEASGEITWAGPVAATAATVSFGIAPIVTPRHGHHVRIDYGLAVTGDASLCVYDVRGRIVRQLATGRLTAGRYTVQWDRHEESGSRVASGIYFVRLRADAREAVRRVVLTN